MKSGKDGGEPFFKQNQRTQRKQYKKKKK